MNLTVKQREYLTRADRRWNFKVGAARSGKTYCDLFTIPMRIRACDEEGAVVLIGYTVGTLCRNLLDPLRRFWGEDLVGAASAKADSVTLFGRKCYLLGADKANQAERLQGMSISYCYGDEVATWSEEVFSMLKSRLDKPRSCFDGTCNPEHPTHWLKRFLDSGVDLYLQTYVIEDNPHLPADFVANLKKEYAGTVWYDRMILGRWVAAEGVIYRELADHPQEYLLDGEGVRRLHPTRIAVGVDFGGTRSGTSFVAVGYPADCTRLAVLRSERFFGQVDARELCDRFADFIGGLWEEWQLPISAYCDSAEPILIRSLKACVSERGLPVHLRKARKGAVNGRIRLTLSLISSRRFFLGPGSDTVLAALRTAVWDPAQVHDQRLDNGSTDVDSLDALEYAMEPYTARLLRQALPSAALPPTAKHPLCGIPSE